MMREHFFSQIFYGKNWLHTNNVFAYWRKINTVGEKNIATTKIRNNYGAIQSFINILCILFGISSLLLF